MSSIYVLTLENEKEKTLFGFLNAKSTRIPVDFFAFPAFIGNLNLVNLAKQIWGNIDYGDGFALDGK